MLLAFPQASIAKEPGEQGYSAYSSLSDASNIPYETPYYMISIGANPKSLIVYTGDLEKRGEFGTDSGFGMEVGRYGVTSYFGSAFGIPTYSSISIVLSYFNTDTQVLKDVSRNVFKSSNVGTSAESAVLSYIPTLFVPWRPGGSRGPIIRFGAGAGPGLQYMNGDAYVTTEFTEQTVANSERINFSGLGAAINVIVYTECRFSPYSSGVILRLSIESSIGFDAKYTYDVAQSALAIGYAF